jgi:hypothetical protein
MDSNGDVNQKLMGSTSMFRPKELMQHLSQTEHHPSQQDRYDLHAEAQFRHDMHSEHHGKMQHSGDSGNGTSHSERGGILEHSRNVQDRSGNQGVRGSNVIQPLTHRLEGGRLHSLSDAEQAQEDGPEKKKLRYS